jgi:hypothetical protein
VAASTPLISVTTDAVEGEETTSSTKRSVLEEGDCEKRPTIEFDLGNRGSIFADGHQRPPSTPFESFCEQVWVENEMAVM